MRSRTAGCARERKTALLAQVDENAVTQVIPDAKHRSIYAQVGYSAGVIVPLRIRDRILGVLGIASDDPTRLYTDFDVATALELGRRGAIALENAQSSRASIALPLPCSERSFRRAFRKLPTFGLTPHMRRRPRLKVKPSEATGTTPSCSTTSASLFQWEMLPDMESMPR